MIALVSSAAALLVAPLALVLAGTSISRAINRTGL
jgi:hypothetical protein